MFLYGRLRPWPTPGADGESVVLRLTGTQSVARPGGDVGAVGQAELAEDVLDVALGGALGDVHEGGDLLVGQALRDVCGDFAFAAGQRPWHVTAQRRGQRVGAGPQG